MAGFWLEFYRQGEIHRHCTAARNQPNELPLLLKRVLDLSDLSLAGPLLVCPTPGSRAQYVTLSHCWGEKKLTRTLQANISRWLTSGIPWTELPQTFRDALNVAINLKFRYLWIDSLCVIQDSAEDWEEESAKMADIYRNADLCISALDSQDSSEGIYRSRDGLLHCPCKLWDEAPPGLCLPTGDNFPVYAFADSLSTPSSSEGPLAHRAWVLQEELISGRRLIFGKDILYWSCLTMQVSTREPHHVLGVPDAKLNNGLYDWHQYFQAAIGGLLDNMDIAGSDMKKLYQCWMCIVEDYCQRGLTKGSDRPTALAGLASEFGRVTHD
jgi:Heterokaryon incompatibility protein (HET)